MASTRWRNRGAVRYWPSPSWSAGLPALVERGKSAATRRMSAEDRQPPLIPLAILIPRIALLDRPEHGLLELLERHIVGIANGL